MIKIVNNKKAILVWLFFNLSIVYANNNYFIGISQNSGTAKYTLNKDTEDKKKSHEGDFNLVKLLLGEKLLSRGFATAGIGVINIDSTTENKQYNYLMYSFDFYLMNDSVNKIFSSFFLEPYIGASMEGIINNNSKSDIKKEPFSSYNFGLLFKLTEKIDLDIAYRIKTNSIQEFNGLAFGLHFNF